MFTWHQIQPCIAMHFQGLKCFHTFVQFHLTYRGNENMLFLFNRFSHLYSSIQPRVKNKWQFTGECSKFCAGVLAFCSALDSLHLSHRKWAPALSWMLSGGQLSKLFNEKKPHVLYMYILRVWYGYLFLTLLPIPMSWNDSFFIL